MKVFLSWSGEKSRAVALALREWLPSVINSIEPFVSSADIDAGMRWQNEVATQLESTSFGIVCVTRDNQASPWLNFEAGALAKAVDSSRVMPLAIDLKPSDIRVPLGQFQAQPATESGISNILNSINGASSSPLTDSRLAKAIAKWWPDLATELRQIAEKTHADTDAAESSERTERTERELLEELLDTVRAIGHRQPPDPLLKLRPVLADPFQRPAIGKAVQHESFGDGVVVEHPTKYTFAVVFSNDGSTRTFPCPPLLVLTDEESGGSDENAAS